VQHGSVLWFLALLVLVPQVILDVVFNHTAEGNERGPTLAFRCAPVGLPSGASPRCARAPLRAQRAYRRRLATQASCSPANIIAVSLHAAAGKHRACASSAGVFSIARSDTAGGVGKLLTARAATAGAWTTACTTCWRRRASTTTTAAAATRSTATTRLCGASSWTACATGRAPGPAPPGGTQAQAASCAVLGAPDHEASWCQVVGHCSGGRTSARMSWQQPCRPGRGCSRVCQCCALACVQLQPGRELAPSGPAWGMLTARRPPDGLLGAQGPVQQRAAWPLDAYAGAIACMAVCTRCFTSWRYRMHASVPQSCPTLY
jgi:hypothetical protein